MHEKFQLVFLVFRRSCRKANRDQDSIDFNCRRPLKIGFWHFLLQTLRMPRTEHLPPFRCRHPPSQSKPHGEAFTAFCRDPTKPIDFFSRRVGKFPQNYLVHQPLQVSEGHRNGGIGCRLGFSLSKATRIAATTVF